MAGNFTMTEDWLADVLADSIDINWSPRDGARAILKQLFEQNIGMPSPSGQYRSVTVKRLDGVDRATAIAKFRKSARPTTGSTKQWNVSDGDVGAALRSRTTLLPQCGGQIADVLRSSTAPTLPATSRAAWADHEAKPWQFRRWIKHTGLRFLGLTP
jgi:hypothetical protein